MRHPDSVRRAYDEVAATYAAHFPGTEPEAPLDLAMVDAFAAAVTDGDGSSRVLDAGCGTGRMSRYLADRGCDVEGVDLSPGMVEQACRAHPDLTFGVAPLTDVPHEDGAFAGVILWYSTIHTPPDGQPAVYAEGVRDVSPAYARFGHQVGLERHLFTPDQVARWATDAGLSEAARLVRQPRNGERDDQAALLFVR